MAVKTRTGPEPGKTRPHGAPRTQRERREHTRARLLRAALELFAESDVEGVAINQITERAGVGFGSFYNHFESKPAIHEALIEQMFKAFGEMLRKATRSIEDPAEIIAISIRCTHRQAMKDPLWGQFLVRSGMATLGLGKGLVEYLHRDLKTGVESGRFAVSDMYTTILACSGALLATIAAELAVKGNREGRAAARVIGRRDSSTPERLVREILRSLGLTEQQARILAARPLPRVRFNALPQPSP